MKRQLIIAGEAAGRSARLVQGAAEERGTAAEDAKRKGGGAPDAITAQMKSPGHIAVLGASS